LLFAFLVAHRLRPATRSELIEAVWPERRPAAPETALSALLTKLRRALGSSALEGKSEVRLALPDDAWVDLEAASEGLHRTESAVALGDWARAWGPARVALNISSRPLMPGLEAPWLDEIRRRLGDIRLRALECVAVAGIGLGGPELASAERSARAVTELAPFRESGYRLLMEVLAARGNVAEALVVYDRLRVLLRDELGAAPGPETQAVHRRLLEGERALAGERVLLTVLFTDIVASTQRLAELGDRAWRELLAEHHARVRSALERFGGREVDAAGDGFFATFDSPAAALGCAGASVAAVRELGIEIRVGVHTGEAELLDGRVAGIAVHVGARVLAAAGPGEVLATSTVKDLVAGSGIEFDDRGLRELKGIPGPWRLFAVPPSVRPGPLA
jgi:class 3 adenylate cyclase